VAIGNTLRSLKLLRAFVCAVVAASLVATSLPRFDPADGGHNTALVLTLSSRAAEFHARSGDHRIEKTKQRNTCVTPFVLADARVSANRSRRFATSDRVFFASSSSRGIRTGRSPPHTIS